MVVSYLALILASPGQLHTTQDERMYTSVVHRKPVPLPSLRDTAEVQLSVVVPMYNEAARLPAMLDDALAWLEGVRAAGHALAEDAPSARAPSAAAALTTPLRTYELVLVDDGSRDATYDVAMAYASARPLLPGAEIRITKLHTNRGKGAAVRHGVLHARGAFVLFADADGATRFADLAVLAREMARILTPAGHGVVVGSRAHLVKSEAVVKRSWVRNLLMRGFHVLLSMLMRPPSVQGMWARAVDWVVPVRMRRPAAEAQVQKLAVQPAIHDTQCGFKLFSRATAATIFPIAHIDRWIFDVELLLLAEMASRTSEADYMLRYGGGDADARGDVLLRLAVPVAEKAVHWTEIDGSKISLLRDSVRMGRDLVIIRLNYALGRWSAPGSVYA
ncbi:dolichyl-phosphate beta-glucosyltransferase [Malassezia brasiliensis]|uniref:dolichyl-phosphate beta-glucosyltransferase n=1 Tax=Malassezia brasiliensis TaxID=1821822 RepID=A0AAF0DWR8_9BASI|nr:dolichyl-phosphate beta-glucosyltransferase [Malassezia brasiliensis]